MKRFLAIFATTLVLILLSTLLMPSTALAADEQLFESYQAGDDSDIEIYGDIWAAQVFTVQGTPHNITGVRVKIFVEGMQAGIITASLRNVISPGIPTGVDLASWDIGSNQFISNATAAWRDITLTGYDLEAYTQYALVLQAPEGNAMNSLHWSMDTAGSAYTGGDRTSSTTGGVAWATEAGSDCMFEVYGEPSLAINSAQLFSSYRTEDDWLTTIHYENTSAPYYGLSESSEQRFKLQLLKGENQLDNGSFEAGNPPSNWVLSGAGASFVRTDAEQKTGLYSGALTRSGADANVTQVVSSPAEFSNRDAVIGAWVKCSTASRARIGIIDDFGGNVSAFHSGSGKWEWLSVVRPTSGVITTLVGYGEVVTGDTTAYFDNAYLIQSNDIPVDNLIAESVPRTWGSKPGSIYLSPTEVASLQWGSVDDHRYAVRLWATYDSNAEATYELLKTDWQGADLNQLDNWCVSVAQQMEVFYPGKTYVINIAGQGESLNEEVGTFFVEGIPLLDLIRPDLFQTVVTNYDISETSHTIPEVDFSARVGTDVSGDMDTVGAIFNLSGEEFTQYILVALFIGLIAFLVTGNILGMVIISLPIIYIGVYVAAISITYLAVGIFLLAAALVWAVTWSRT